MSREEAVLDVSVTGFRSVGMHEVVFLLECSKSVTMIQGAVRLSDIRLSSLMTYDKGLESHSFHVSIRKDYSVWIPSFTASYVTFWVETTWHEFPTAPKDHIELEGALM